MPRPSVWVAASRLANSRATSPSVKRPPPHRPRRFRTLRRRPPPSPPLLPRLGQLVAGDADSYRYLAESIRMHPGQEELKVLMKKAGFGHVDFHNMSGGVVALHVGIKC